MWILLLPLSTAADLTFQCPGVESAADTFAWSDTGRLGVLDRMEGLMALAQEHFEPGCPAAWTDAGLPETTFAEATCTTSAGVTISVSQEVLSGGTNLVVSLLREEGAWTTFEFSANFAAERDDARVFDAQSFEASWTGSLDPTWPEDAQIAGSWSYSLSGEGLDRREALSESWQDPECAWRSQALSGVVSGWDVELRARGATHRVSVMRSVDQYDCADARFDLDEAEVSADGWGACAVPDEDDDGFTADLDCDDRNALVFPDESGQCTPLGPLASTVTEALAEPLSRRSVVEVPLGW